MKGYQSLKESLSWIAFDSNSGIIDMKDPKYRNSYLWAIQEGIERIQRSEIERNDIHFWKLTTAAKDHSCVRGCNIKSRFIYVKEESVGWGNNTKFCLGCAAMILYYLKVYELPAVIYTDYKFDYGPVNLNSEKNL
jgi:hypothetical protein